MKNLLITFLLILSLFFVCCQNTTKVEANFEWLIRNDSTENIQLVTQNAQEISSKKGENIIANGLEYEINHNDLRINIKDDQAFIKINPLAIGLPGTWKNYSELQCTIENNSKAEAKINIILWGPRGRLPDTLQIPALQTASKTIDLHDLPLIGSPNEKYQVNQIELQFNDQKGANSFVKSIDLVASSGERDFVVVDRFGQRKSNTWPGKVSQDDELKEHLNAETQSLANPFAADNYDNFFGLKIDEKFKNNGFFSVDSKNVDGEEIWFFVTPVGNPFWSFGITGIRPKKPLHSVTLVRGNEQLFEQLPDPKGEFSAAYIDSTFSFYQLNLLKKYGNLQGWRDMTFKRLTSWGLNTIGNWAEDSILDQSKIPFTYSFETEVKRWKKDVLDPGWHQYVDSVLSQAIDLKENKYLLGYFVDNESGWGNLKLLQTLPKDAYLRKEWISELKRKYVSIGAFNYNSKTNFKDWTQISNCIDPNIISKRDLVLLDELYTKHYFRTIAETLKQYDPNHLYLGCRFTRKLKPAHILKIAGIYCDVITVNVYSYEPIKEDMDKWHQLTGKPILIGEHQAALNSPRQLPLRWQTFTTEERYDYFVNYVSTWAKMPYSLGSHWYQYSDQHITGRASNGENQIIGFVDITDQPYQEMIDAARYNSAHIYQWHGLVKAEILP